MTTSKAGHPSSYARAVHRTRSRLSTPRFDRLLVSSLVGLAIVLVLLGLAERIWMVDHFSINSDQAVVGLMAKEILHGHFVAFFWGQHYGGAEPYVTSVLFALFGSSDTVLNLTPVVLSAMASVLVYLIGRFYLPRTFAALAALAIWVWPTISLTSSTQEIGYVFACLDFGLLAVLFASRIRERRGSTMTNWAMLGLSGGACLWASPEFLFFLAPCLFLVTPSILRAWRSERKVVVSNLAAGTAGATLGGLPFWWVTASTHFATITDPNNAPYPGTLATRATSMFTHAIPIASGLQRPFSGTWFGGPVIGKLGLVVALVVVVGGLAWALIRHRPRTVVPLIAFIVAYLVIYPLLPPTFFWQDGRYIVFLLFLSVIVALYPLGLVPWRRTATAVAATAVVGLACVTIFEIPGLYSGFSVRNLAQAFHVQHTSASPLAAGLEKVRISNGYAAYWLAYKLDFESKHALTFTPIPTDNMRNGAYLDRVDSAPRPAWILCQPANVAACASVTDTTAVNPPGLTWASLSSWLHRVGIPYTSTTIQGFIVVVPAARITPTVLEKAGVLAP